MGAVRHICLSVWLVLVAGCGASDEAADLESLVDGQSLMGTAGRLTGSFLMDEPHKGVDNPLAIELKDEGQALADAEVLVSPWMPAHAHGSRDQQAQGDDDGMYHVDELSFPMAGYWELRVEVSLQGELVDQFVVPVVVAETND